MKDLKKSLSIIELTKDQTSKISGGSVLSSNEEVMSGIACTGADSSRPSYAPKANGEVLSGIACTGADSSRPSYAPKN